MGEGSRVLAARREVASPVSVQLHFAVSIAIDAASPAPYLRCTCMPRAGDELQIQLLERQGEESADREAGSASGARQARSAAGSRSRSHRASAGGGASKGTAVAKGAPRPAAAAKKGR